MRALIFSYMHGICGPYWVHRSPLAVLWESAQAPHELLAPFCHVIAIKTMYLIAARYWKGPRRLNAAMHTNMQNTGSKHFIISQDFWSFFQLRWRRNIRQRAINSWTGKVAGNHRKPLQCTTHLEATSAKFWRGQDRIGYDWLQIGQVEVLYHTLPHNLLKSLEQCQTILNNVATYWTTLIDCICGPSGPKGSVPWLWRPHHHLHSVWG